MWPWQQWKTQWWSRREASLHSEFALREGELRARLLAGLTQLEEKERELKGLEADCTMGASRLEQRRVELAQANEDLREQLRLLEAKARPDAVWAEAFSLGFSKAWDMMLPIMTGGMERLKTAVRDAAIQETVDSLRPSLEAEMGVRLKRQEELLHKITEFESRRDASRGMDAQRYEAYLTALRWAVGTINGYALPSH